MSLISHIYHIVIRTKRSEMRIREENKSLLYKYINGIITKRGGKVIRINGIANHIHILVKFTSVVDLSAVVHDIKLGANYFIKQNRPLFPEFISWAAEYASFTCSAGNLEGIIRYIDNQETHHGIHSFNDEMRRFCALAGVEYRKEDWGNDK